VTDQCAYSDEVTMFNGSRNRPACCDYNGPYLYSGCLFRISVGSSTTLKAGVLQSWTPGRRGY